uniref:Uncharacterized protein n=1 Tax=Fagus sylvatica TaxID=28930 RepID=A0A2N9HST2_FAGSY
MAQTNPPPTESLSPSPVSIFLHLSQLAAPTVSSLIVHPYPTGPVKPPPKKLELLETARILFGLLVQIFTIGTTISLIGNMSPPKRAS